MQHIFIIGSKGLGNYGGYETFVDKLTEYHQHDTDIKYHIACKANGDGFMDESKLDGVTPLPDNCFLYHNAHCFKVTVPNIGPAQAIYYDIASLKYCIDYCKANSISNPIVYILACRIGPFIRKYVKQIHSLGGKVYVNPDGHEWMRGKWSKPVRKYWKISEQLMVKQADLLVCDSVNIEKYIHKEYGKYDPNTTFIAYGSDIRKSVLSDDDPKYVKWMAEKRLKPNQYYLVVGRFVPENNYETMIREFMKSDTDKDFAIITTTNERLMQHLEHGLHVSMDKRVKFVGTVYDQELLKKIRENAFAYLHGHEVGGTNPSLLEALGSTKVNLLLDVGFNREVAGDAARYWTKEEGCVCSLINETDKLDENQRNEYGIRAQARIADAYSWQSICDKYKQLYI